LRRERKRRERGRGDGQTERSGRVRTASKVLFNLWEPSAAVPWALPGILWEGGKSTGVAFGRDKAV
jgi:hypothetical protein